RVLKLLLLKVTAVALDFHSLLDLIGDVVAELRLKCGVNQFLCAVINALRGLIFFKSIILLPVNERRPSRRLTLPGHVRQFMRKQALTLRRIRLVLPRRKEDVTPRRERL